MPVVLATGYAELPNGKDPSLPRLSKPYLQEELVAQIAKVLTRFTAPTSSRWMVPPFHQKRASQDVARSARLAHIMEMSLDLLGNAVVSGVLLGGFYAAVTIGVSISFGMLDIVNIAHPAFIILGSYIAYIANTALGIDPILASVIALPAFYLLGAGGLPGLLRRL